MREVTTGRWRRWRRRAAGTLLVLLALTVAGIMIRQAGTRLVGNVEAWSHWQDSHRVGFLVWRLALYALTARGWWWMRQRLLRREPSVEARQRLRRAEIAAITAVVLLEGTAPWQHF